MRAASWRTTFGWTEEAGTEAKAEVAMTSAGSADAGTAREVGTEAKAEMAVASANRAAAAWRTTSWTKVEAEAATAVATESANSAAAAAWSHTPLLRRRLAAAAAGAESGCRAVAPRRALVVSGVSSHGGVCVGGACSCTATCTGWCAR